MNKIKYNSFDKIIHKLALSNNISNLLFKLEYFLFSEEKKIKEKNYFITGLARSGTTQFLNTLYETNKFASYTYSDMPFIFSPNIWKKARSFFGNNQSSKIERAHADGIKIDISSPEALEEPIWMYLKKKLYIKKNYLITHDLTNDDLKFFLKIIDFVKIKCGKEVYLSKNNFNILRLKSLLNFFSDSYFFIIFRNPLEQANSLFKQHLNFLKLQKNDKFILDYMSSLGHFDFGLNHKYYLFDDKINNEIKDFDLNYWLSTWINVYSYLHKFKNKYENCKFICYENLCYKKKEYLKNFIPKEKIILDSINFDNFKNKNRNIDNKLFNDSLVQKSLSLYSSLKDDIN